MGYKTWEIDHRYPKNVHILNHPSVNALLTKLSHPDTIQPEFNRLVSAVYTTLFTEAINSEWPVQKIKADTRMTAAHPGVQVESEILDRQQKAVLVNIARAGALPSQVGFELLCHIVNPLNVRMDHIYASRVTDANNSVTHTDLTGSKIGGDVDDALVFAADPMGATGYSLAATLDHYKKNVTGTAKKIIAIHLIVTPEYIQHLHKTHPDVIIYTARLDRGLSSKEVLGTVPGTHWEQEKGLNDKQYIVPGAGGVGELINNSFV